MNSTVAGQILLVPLEKLTTSTEDSTSTVRIQPGRVPSEKLCLSNGAEIDQFLGRFKSGAIQSHSEPAIHIKNN